MISREEFEAWYRKNVCSWSNLSIDSDGEYFGQMARTAWKSWQASRQALVVELPAIGGEFTDVQKNTRNRCRQAIEAAGVRVKP